MKTKRYVLRTTAKPASASNPAFLSQVRRGGLLVVWGLRAEARTFTTYQMVNLMREHPHIRGRWVLA